ncbi:MAG TPA: hypothetical protein VHQ01_03630 [Pyrinomonadaceae bacterium]|jgi:hypothetical protein|nr:hypothetical protein [Pyrinomonadaceae bacterium]
MKQEALIEQLAEIRALSAVNCFMIQLILECVGCDGDAVTTAVDNINTQLANGFESQMRKACGLEPRPEARTAVLPKLAEFDLMRKTDWNKAPEH